MSEIYLFVFYKNRQTNAFEIVKAGNVTALSLFSLSLSLFLSLSSVSFFPFSLSLSLSRAHARQNPLSVT